MKMLAVYAAGTERDAPIAKTGEPCVPNFRVCGRHMFVGLETDGLTSNATPKSFPDETVNKLFEEYKKRYSTLPEDLLEKYFFASASAADLFSDGARVKISHEDNDITRFYSPESETTMEVHLE